MVLRYYKNAPSHTIPGGVANSSTTSIVVDSVVGWPTQFPFACIIEPDSALEEIVDVTNVVGSTLTVTRGVDGSTASAHAAGSKIALGWIARDATEANTHINATTGVHGATGALVDAGSAQAIAGNKTFSGTTTANGPLNANGGGTLAGSFTFSSPPVVDGAFLRNLQPTSQTFAASGTWTKPANLKSIRVTVVGAGGGSGGGGTTGAAQGSCGGGGGGGESAVAIIPAASLAATVAVTVGVGGAGALAIGGNGAAGGNSSFGGHLVANGGSGGGAVNATANGVAGGGVGGTGGGGTTTAIARIKGAQGDTARVVNGEPIPTRGGNSTLGMGASQGAATASSSGTAGLPYGGGAGGGFVRPSTAGVLGSAGADGIVIVEEYY
jgi:hypothetical protein